MAGKMIEFQYIKTPVGTLEGGYLMKIKSSSGKYDADTCATFNVVYTAENLSGYAQRTNMVLNSVANHLLAVQAT